MFLHCWGISLVCLALKLVGSWVELGGILETTFYFSLNFLFLSYIHTHTHMHTHTEIYTHSHMHIVSMHIFLCNEEGNGNPLQYVCLENPMDGGAW